MANNLPWIVLWSRWVPLSTLEGRLLYNQILSAYTGGLGASSIVAFPFLAHQLMCLCNRIYNFQSTNQRRKKIPSLCRQREDLLTTILKNILFFFKILLILINLLDIAFCEQCIFLAISRCVYPSIANKVKSSSSSSLNF